jgi:serine/threonine protein kinase
MSTVFRAVHIETGQVVALKAFKPQYADQPVLLRRFENEFHASRRLNHPNLVKAIEYGVDEGVPYIAMEYVDGRNLAAVLHHGGAMPEEQAVQLIVQIADALAQAHAMGYVHRDIKPANILVTHEGFAKLTDLGLVKDLEGGENLTHTWTTLGTLCFVAPEQFQDAKRVTLACDIHGLGATLYQAVTGIMPFPGNKGLAVLSKKLANDFVPPIALVHDLNPRINRAICRALDANPEKRQETCAEFVLSLTGQTLDEYRATKDAVEPEHKLKASPSFDEARGVERRQAARFPISLETSCRPIRGNIKDRWSAEMVDVSSTGCRLLVPRRFEVGAMLQVEFSNDEEEPFTLVATVRWVKMQHDRWETGLRFHRALSETELGLFVETLSLTIVSEDADASPPQAE